MSLGNFNIDIENNNTNNHYQLFMLCSAVYIMNVSKNSHLRHPRPQRSYTTNKEEKTSTPNNSTKTKHEAVRHRNLENTEKKWARQAVHPSERNWDSNWNRQRLKQ